jgi:hypothetical protein
MSGICSVSRPSSPAVGLATSTTRMKAPSSGGRWSPLAAVTANLPSVLICTMCGRGMLAGSMTSSICETTATLPSCCASATTQSALLPLSLWHSTKRFG